MSFSWVLLDRFDKFGIIFLPNIHTPYSLPYTSLQQFHFTTCECV